MAVADIKRTQIAGRAFAVALLTCAALAVVASPARAVVGGQPVPAGQFDYVANVLIAGDPECTGVLIAPQWVLTAGHCSSVTGALSEGLAPSPVVFPAGLFTVYLGTPNTDGSGGEMHTVDQVVVDPAFLVTNGDGNDVTLLHLSTPSQQPTVKIAPDEPSLWAAGKLATVAGFGTTSESSSTKPATMQAAKVPYVTSAYCAVTYPFGPEIVANDGWFDPNTMVCAGYAKGGTDVCEGDSGGPNLVPVNGTLELIATTSFGHGCAEPGYPTAYALVAAGPIREFIAEHVPSAFAPDTASSPTQPTKPTKPTKVTPPAAGRKPAANAKHLRPHRNRRG